MLPVRGWGAFLQRKRVGSLMQPLLEFMSILALIQQVWPNSVPAFISAHIFMFCSTAAHKTATVNVEMLHVTDSHSRSSVIPHTVISAFGLNALLPLLLHLLGGGVVDVGFALVEELLAVAQYDGKTVTGVGELVWFDLQHSHVFQNDLRTGRNQRWPLKVVYC